MKIHEIARVSIESHLEECLLRHQRRALVEAPYGVQPHGNPAVVNGW
jgi:hypothetical protein